MTEFQPLGNGISALLLLILLSLGLSALMLVLSYGCSRHVPYESKLTAYECGFNAFKNATKPFSVSFYLVGILFLIFDLEMIYLFPWAMVCTSLSLTNQMGALMFIALMFVGLSYEWTQGGLEWC